MQESRQGARHDLAQAVQTIQEGVAAGGSEARPSHVMKRLAELHPVEFVKYHRGFELLTKTLAPTRLPQMNLMWRPWQQDLANSLDKEPDDRHIVWVYDEVGNKGKSTFVRQYINDETKDAIVLSGKTADMAYLYNKERVVFFDITRTQVELLDHLMSFAEQLKNGFLLSTKYMPEKKVFQPPHVVFFANVPCPTGKWSADRVVEIVLD